MENHVFNVEIQAGGTADIAFNQIKALQQLGVLDKNVFIILNNIRIPAGYLETAEDLETVYYALLEKNKDAIAEFAVTRGNTMGKDNMNGFLLECTMSMNGGHVIGEAGFSKEETEQIVNEAAEQRLEDALNDPTRRHL